MSLVDIIAVIAGAATMLGVAVGVTARLVTVHQRSRKGLCQKTRPGEVGSARASAICHQELDKTDDIESGP